jgi:FtsZ-binding cell division protein ZapB
MPEPAVSDKLGEILDSIYVPEEIAAAIVSSLESDSSRIEATRQQELCAARQRLATLRTRMDQMYEEQTGWQD